MELLEQRGMDLRITTEDKEQQQIRAATYRYLAALPLAHREVLTQVAALTGTKPTQVIMGALADVVERYRETIRSVRPPETEEP